MKDWLKDKKGGAEYISFIFSLILIMVIVLNFIEPIKIAVDYLLLENTQRMALLEMEQSGGLTPTIESHIRDSLKNYNFDLGKVQISTTTPYPVQYNDRIDLTVTYDRDYKTITLTNFLMVAAIDHIKLKADGSSSSREYFKTLP